MKRKKVDGFWGWHINEAIAELIKRAEAGPVETEFNGVTIYADANSDAALLYRDWNRALSGYIPGPVGPHPSHRLSSADLASDAEIEKQNEVKRAESDAQDAIERKGGARLYRARLKRRIAAPLTGRGYFHFRRAPQKAAHALF